MPRPASTSARRHDSNHHLSSTPSVPPPSYKSHDLAVKPTDINTTEQHPADHPNHDDTTVHSSILQPRVAVALGLSAKWHPLLFVCRLMSILPALWWGVPVALRLLAQAIVLVGSSSAACAYGDRTQGIPWLRGYGRIAGESGNDSAGLEDSPLDFETRLRITEMALGIVWCASSAYLSFTFTDCLMSRWLLLYTPQATLVRLLATNTTNLYLTSQALHLTGASRGDDDPRLFLPAWITIATCLTGLYHITQRKINIRKETRLSISVFSVASFVSMVSLLATVHLQGGAGGGGGGSVSSRGRQQQQAEWPRVPVVEMARSVLEAAGRAREKVREWGGERGNEL